MGSVSSGQRFKNASTACPICGGFDSAARGKGERCAGFISDDGDWVHCTRDDGAGRIKASKADPPTYAHKMHGDCNCGQSHGPAKPSQDTYAKPTTVASYNYVDQNGDYLYTAERMSNKSFYQHRNGTRGLGGIETTLYKLPDVIAAREAGDTIYLVEGEKDADTLNARGFVATTNSGGSKAWKKHHAEWLKGASHVVLVPDLDKAGYKLTLDRVTDLELLKVPYSIKLPDQSLPPKSDVTDHIEAGHAVEDMLEVDVERIAALHVEAKGEKAPEETFNAYTFQHLTDIRPPTRSDYLIKGVLEQQTLAVLYGQSGSTKSFQAQDWCLHIAAGREWRGKRVQQGAVLYVAAEGAGGMRKRLYASVQEHGFGEGTNFHLISRNIGLGMDSQDITDFVQSVVNEFGGENISLVVIDTLARAMVGMDENQTKDMMDAVESVTRGIMEKLGCAALLIHHSGKNEAAGARGSSSLKGALDTELELRLDADSGIATMRVLKQKDGEAGGTYMHKLRQVAIGIDQDGDPILSAVVEPLGTEEVAKHKAAQSSSKGKKSISEVIRACLDLEGKGESKTVPANVLAASGYTAWVAKQGWDTATPVKGFHRTVVQGLLIARYEPKSDAGRPPDTLPDKQAEYDHKREEAARKSASRMIKRSIDEDMLCAHDGWVWLREPERDAPDTVRTL